MRMLQATLIAEVRTPVAAFRRTWMLDVVASPL
jgi:hypothetical protein